MPDSAQEAYVAQLVTLLTGRGPCSLTWVCQQRPKPSSIAGGLKAFLQRRLEFVVTEGQQSGREKVSLSTTHASAAPSTEETAPRSKRKDPTNIVCRFFQNGTCRNGDSCKFLHVLPDGETTTKGAADAAGGSGGRPIDAQANSLATSDVTLVSHTHGRDRRAERGIDRRDLQAAVKHGRKERANPGPCGQARYRFTYKGVVYITDESCRHEITSWRDDGRDDIEAPHAAAVYGAHVVLIVDASGSMRSGDVDGYATRTAAVYECLARDLVEPQLQYGFLGAGGNVVTSLIEMSDDATVLLERVPLDRKLVATLRKCASSRAQSHGNYLPALDKAIELLDASNKEARLLLVFLSDGAPSDHTKMPCKHGIFVWRPTGRSRHDGRPELEHCQQGHQSCRSDVLATVRKECERRIKTIGQRFGRDRIILATVGFAHAKEDFSILEAMAKLLPRGSFSKTGLQASALKTAFSSLSSSLSTLRTESAGGRQLTLRSDVVVRREDPEEIRFSRMISGKGWVISEGVVHKYKYSQADDKLLPPQLLLEGGIAFRIEPFASGAERFAHRGSEIQLLSSGEKRRNGPWLVTKQSMYRELLFDLDFHLTFCRMHCQAQALATIFNARLQSLGMSSAWSSKPGLLASCTVRFVQCVIYKLKHQGRYVHVLAEPELEGRYVKYNNNAGGVRGPAADPASPTKAALGAIVEEDEDEEDEEVAAGVCDPCEVPQAFSHFTFVHSQHEKLVCDLQGVWNAADGYTLTDPVLHAVSGEKHRNGATDKGAAGIGKFFDTHVCGPLCRALSLPPTADMQRVLARKERELTAAEQRRKALEAAEEERKAAEAERTQHEVAMARQGPSRMELYVPETYDAQCHEYLHNFETRLGGAIVSHAVKVQVPANALPGSLLTFTWPPASYSLTANGCIRASVVPGRAKPGSMAYVHERREMQQRQQEQHERWAEANTARRKQQEREEMETARLLRLQQEQREELERTRLLAQKQKQQEEQPCIVQ